METEISRIGLGCVTFGREIGEDAAFAFMDYAYERGINFFDTAAVYGGGASEIIVGKWLASRKPAGVVVATKLLPPFTKDALHQSLERLQVNKIELLYLHAWGEGAEVLLEDGLVRNLGASNFNLKQLQSNHFHFIQNNHNLAVSDLTEDMMNHCQANNIRIVTYSPLGAGYLTGKHLNGIQKGSRFDIMPGHQQVYASAGKRLAKLQQVANRTGHSMVHLALAWALHQPVDCVLIGGRNASHLDQALKALSFNDPQIFADPTASH